LVSDGNRGFTRRLRVHHGAVGADVTLAGRSTPLAVGLDAEAAEVSDRSAFDLRGWAPWRTEGTTGLTFRSSTPLTQTNQR
jgi:hypothetical protein